MSSNTYRLIVVELDQASGARRRPDRPRLYLGVTSQDPAERFEQLKRSNKGDGMIRDHGIKLRSDLTRNYPPTTQAEANRQKQKLRAKLNRQGYTVNGDTTVWHVYVIELDDQVGPRKDPRLPWVYVGESSKTIEDRFDEHITGARNTRGPLSSKVVHKHGVQLRHDLFRDEPTYFTQKDARQAEKTLAERLRAAGYSVEGGH